MFETLFFWGLLLVTAASFYLTSKSQARFRAATLTIASILALVFVLRIKLHFVVSLSLLVTSPPHITLLVVLFPPIPALHHPPRLQNVLPDLISLRFFLGMDVLPPQHAAAAHTADVTDCVCAGDELARNGLMGECIGQIGWAPC